MATMTARRASTCPECGAPINPGDRIATLRRRAAWAHVDCAADQIRRIAADDLDALTYGYGSL